MRMLYRPGNARCVWGIPCDMKAFKGEEVEQALSDGWFVSPLDFEVDEQAEELSRDDLKLLAEEYGVKVGKKSNERLLQEIQDAKGRLG